MAACLLPVVVLMRTVRQTYYYYFFYSRCDVVRSCDRTRSVRHCAFSATCKYSPKCAIDEDFGEESFSVRRADSAPVVASDVMRCWWPPNNEMTNF
jgi:hypothetical protein